MGNWLVELDTKGLGGEVFGDPETGGREEVTFEGDDDLGSFGETGGFYYGSLVGGRNGSLTGILGKFDLGKLGGTGSGDGRASSCFTGTDYKGGVGSEVDFEIRFVGDA